MEWLTKFSFKKGLFHHTCKTCLSFFWLQEIVVHMSEEVTFTHKFQESCNYVTA